MRAEGRHDVLGDDGVVDGVDGVEEVVLEVQNLRVAVAGVVVFIIEQPEDLGSVQPGVPLQGQDLLVGQVAVGGVVAAGIKTLFKYRYWGKYPFCIDLTVLSCYQPFLLL